MRCPWERLRNGMRNLAARKLLKFMQSVSNSCIFLMHWFLTNLRDMIAHSKEWARSRGLLQKNEVHGKEEWKIPTDREFMFKNETEQSSTARGSMEVDDYSDYIGSWKKHQLQYWLIINSYHGSSGQWWHPFPEWSHWRVCSPDSWVHPMLLTHWSFPREMAIDKNWTT